MGILTPPSNCKIFDSSGYLAEIEHNQIIVQMAGLSKEVPSVTEFEEWSSGLVTQDIYNDIIRMEPISFVNSFIFIIIFDGLT